MDPGALYTVIVDDRDQRIKLEGFNGENVGVCNSYLGHSKYSTGGTATFSFNGTAVELHGNIPSASENIFSCTVDGQAAEKLRTTPLLAHSTLDDVICSASQLDPNSEHTVQLTVAPSTSNTVQFDYILYETSYTNLQNGNILYYHSGREDAFTYTSGWSESTSGTHLTTTERSTTNFTFYGSDASLYIVGHESKGRFRGEIYIYSDTGDSFANKAALTEGNVDGCPFYRYYETGAMSAGNHSIMVEYRGGFNQSDNTPIEVNFYTVPVQGLIAEPNGAGAQVSPGTSSTTPSISSGPSISPEPTPSTGISPGAIAGIVVGVIIVIVVPVVVILFRRRRSHQKKWGWGQSGVDPFTAPSGSGQTTFAGSSQNLMSERGAGGVMTEIREEGKPIYHLAPSQSGVGPSRAVNNDRAEVFMHSDSGVRLGNVPSSERLEIPPMYTEQ